MTTANGRSADHPIDAQFLQRWSPRAYDGAPITQDDLWTILEAAHWAPSSYNSQPWRFLYAHRDTPEWSRFLEFLNPFNRGWAQHAAVLVVLVSSRLMVAPGGAPVPSHSHSLDAGAAWGYLALQAAKLDIHAHAMVGVDLDAIRSGLGVPEDFNVECVIALGRRGDGASLPEGLRAREVPNTRRKVSELAAAGDFANLGPGTSV